MGARNVYKAVGAHMEFAARRKPPGEGEDLVDVHCITFNNQMALPMSYIYTLFWLVIDWLTSHLFPALDDTQLLNDQQVIW